MPLLLHKTVANDLQLCVWQIEEDIQWFHERLQLNETDYSAIKTIHVESKLLEFLASRYVLRILLASDDEHTLIKDANGRPYLQNQSVHISLSHCAGFAAAIINITKPVGIDIELVDSRVRRIKDRFLSEQDLINLGGENVTDEALIAAWAAKEVIYKVDGEKGISFQNQIHLGMLPELPGIMDVTFTKNGINTTYSIVLEQILPNLILAYSS